MISVNVAGGKTRLVPLQVEYTLRSTFSTRGTIFYKIQDSINQAVKVLVFCPVLNADELGNYLLTNFSAVFWQIQII